MRPGPALLEADEDWAARQAEPRFERTVRAEPLSAAGSSGSTRGVLQEQRGARSLAYQWRRATAGLALACADVLALTLALFTSVVALSAFADAAVGADTVRRLATYGLPLWLIGAFYLRLLPSWGMGFTEELRRLFKLTPFVCAGTAALFVVSIGFSVPTAQPLLATAALSLLAVPALRSLARRALIARCWWGVPAVIYGSGAKAVQLQAYLQEHPGLGFEPVRCVDLASIPHRVDVRASKARGFPRQPEGLVGVLVQSGLSSEMARVLLERPLAKYPWVLVVPDVEGIPPLCLNLCDLNGSQLGVEVVYHLRNPFRRGLKRAVELALVLVFAPVWVLLCTVIAFLIWLEDRGHPFFFQKRVGLDGRPFWVCKFRTMRPRAEQILQAALHADTTLRREWETSFKLKKDPRVTRIGAVLRATSLDEIPQFANVLMGDMALVGPRPLPAYHHDALPLRVREVREQVRPGLTGLWQVSGRSEAGIEGMVHWDPYYVHNWSLWLDAVIAARTMKVVLKGTGAY